MGVYVCTQYMSLGGGSPICVLKQISIFMYVYMCACMYVCTCVYMCVCVCMYLHRLLIYMYKFVHTCILDNKSNLGQAADYLFTTHE